MISPVLENQLSGLPKVWACVGSYEVFLDDVKLFIEKLLLNNVKAELAIEDANIHDYAVAKPLSRNGAYDNTIKRIGKFLYCEKN
jgi:acetyl esterase/lipase